MEELTTHLQNLIDMVENPKHSEDDCSEHYLSDGEMLDIVIDQLKLMVDKIKINQDINLNKLIMAFYKYEETDYNVMYFFYDLYEFLEEHNNYMETDYTSVSQFNEGEPHRIITKINLN